MLTVLAAKGGVDDPLSVVSLPAVTPDMPADYLIALVIAVIGSVLIHLSQGLMKLAILRRQQGDKSPGQRYLYLSGMLLNFSAPLWVILANRFAPTVIFTSVYAIGLLALLWFSCWKLGLALRKRDLLGALLLTLGAILLAIGNIQNGLIHMSQLNIVPMWWMLAMLCLLVWPVSWLCKQFSWLPQGLLFGFLGGAFLAVDSLLKGIAQSDSGVSAFLPSTLAGMAIFALSFVGAAMAFGMTQWAHARGAPPSATIAGYDAAYMLTPLLLISLALPGGHLLNWMCLLGLGCTLLSLVLLHRPATEKEKKGA